MLQRVALEWRERYGRLPSSYDWSRTHARQRGERALRRLNEGQWPPASVVTALFGTWASARAAAETSQSANSSLEQYDRHCGAACPVSEPGLTNPWEPWQRLIDSIGSYYRGQLLAARDRTRGELYDLGEEQLDTVAAEGRRVANSLDEEGAR